MKRLDFSKSLHSFFRSMLNIEVIFVQTWPDGIVYFIDFSSFQEILVKSISALILLLLKQFKVNHIYQVFLYFEMYVMIIVIETETTILVMRC